MAYFIFDLDGTVICSKHRHATREDGSLDLEHWFANATPEKIMLDSLLPLAHTMRALGKTKHKIVICTARTIQMADKIYLWENRLPYSALLHRLPGCYKRDHELKVELLSDYFASEGFNSIADASPIMFEDNLAVIEELTNHGVKMYNAIEINRRIVA